MMKKIIHNQNAWLGLAFLMMAILFYSSSQTYAEQSQQSNLHHFLKQEPGESFFAQFKVMYAGEMHDASKDYFGYVEFLIRKAAHFSIYFLMGLGLFNGLKNRIQQWGLSIIIAYLAATGYAGLDEFHQMLTGGRTPLFQDVILDSMGALTAILLASLVMLIQKGRKKL
jgi:VanZ family protein